MNNGKKIGVTLGGAFKYLVLKTLGRIELS